MASEEQVERIREATNIVDLIGEHVRLKKRGRNFTGLCPFHNEKTPSFSVLEDKGIFKCFGCGKGGDVFSFVMQMENLTFPEAIQKLARRANIDIEPVQSDEELQARNQRDSLYDILKAAATWYFRVLRASAGQEAMSYLTQRDLEHETIRKFGLGFAPDQPGVLIDALTGQGYSLESLERAGLITRREGGDWYERFRGRVIFPVFSATGRIVGFGGRVLPGVGNSPAKYINSPDTAVYNKSQILYGLFQAKDAIRSNGYSILVEGYADVLAVHQAGVENVVAASGTSLTTEQLNLLHRYTTTVVLLFDADTAGKNAAIRGIELALEAGFNVDTVVLPSGDDPDSFIRANGVEAFKTAIEHRQSWIETKAQWFEEHGAFRDPGQMTNAIRAIVESIAKIPDAIKRSLFVQKLGERFHLSEQMLTMELQKELQKLVAASARRTIQEPQSRPEWNPPLDDEAESSIVPLHEQVVPRAESTLLEAMIADPKGVARVLDSTTFDLDYLTHPIVREIVSFLLQEVDSEETPDISSLYASYRGQPEYERILIAHGMADAVLSNNWDDADSGTRMRFEQQAMDAIAKIESGESSRQLSEAQQSLKTNMPPDEEERILRESIILAQRRLKLPAAEFANDDRSDS